MSRTEAVPPVVSVVIPSYNSKPWIRECLSSVRAQSTDLPFEVILVDSSNDGTEEIVAKEFPEIRLVHLKQRCFVGVARNLGTEKARGEVVMFLDTDCVAPDTWIDRMYASIKTSGADGVGGSVENGTPWSITGSVGFWLEFFRFLQYDGPPYKTLFLMGGNSCFKREVFQRSRYYDCYDVNKVGEDFIFNWRLLREGKTLLFYPGISVTHMNRRGMLNVLRYQYRLGVGACSYRGEISGNITGLMRRFPTISFLAPLAVVPWIGYTVMRRKGVCEFVKFVAMSPGLFVANCAWALGFYRELRRGNSSRRLWIKNVWVGIARSLKEKLGRARGG